MRILVSGSHGLIGSTLVDHLKRGGHDVVRLVRGAPSTGEVNWDPEAGRLDAADLQNIEAVVHLAGEGIGDRRWSPDQKAKILDSRVKGTTLLSSAIASLSPAPTVMVSASAIGYYGDRGDERLTEESGPGTGFLARVCQAWEEATSPAERAGIRVVHARTGIVLSVRGGALKKQLPLFKLGAGGRLGSGRQYTSWISIDDEVGALAFAVNSPELRGAVNLTAPTPVTNADFARELAHALHRPAILPVPRMGLALALGGEMADEMILSGARILPTKLLDAGYAFAHPELGEAFRSLFGSG